MSEPVSPPVEPNAAELLQALLKLRAFRVTMQDGSERTILSNYCDVGNVAGHAVFIDMDAAGKLWHRTIVNVHQWAVVEELPMAYQGDKGIN